MPSTSVADYQVLRDASFDLDASTPNREFTTTLVLPDDLNSEDGPRKPIIAFKILPFEESKVTIIIKGVVVMEETFSKSLTRGYWETFNWSALPSMGPTNAEFRLVLGDGRARFSDIIVWYQINR